LLEVLLSAQTPSSVCLARKAAATPSRAAHRNGGIDPLDAHQFTAHSYPFFATSVGPHLAGVAGLLGCHRAPALRQWHWAAPVWVAGAYDQRLQSERLQRSGRVALVTGFAYDRSEPARTPQLRRVLLRSPPPQTVAIRRGGSAAVESGLRGRRAGSMATWETRLSSSGHRRRCVVLV